MLDYDVIETPENVELQQPLAGIGSRFLAGLLDNILIVGLYLALFIAFWIILSIDPIAYVERRSHSRGWLVAGFLVVLFLIYWGYYIFLEAILNGQTPGKRSVRIRVVKEGGQAVELIDIIIRNLLRVVDGLPFGYALGGICMFFSKRIQRLGDMAAGTLVVSEQVADYSASADKRVKAKWEYEATASALRATGLKPEEYRILSNYWARRSQLTLEARARMLPKLVEPILKRTGQALQDTSFATLEAYVESLMYEAWAAETRQKEANERRPL